MLFVYIEFYIFILFFIVIPNLWDKFFELNDSHYF